MNTTNSHTWICTHCDLPLDGSFESPQVEGSPVFCCQGCEAVYEILHRFESGHYYTLKKDAVSLREAQPVRLSKHRYEYLDQLPASDRMHFFVEGVHCSACVWLLERLHQFLPSIQRATLDFGNSIVTVRLNEKGSFCEVAQLLHKLGYIPHPIEDEDQVEHLMAKDHRQALIRIGISGAAAGNIMLFSISSYAGLSGGLETWFGWISLGLCFPVVFYGGWPFFRSAWGAFINRQVTIDIPVVLAIGIGFFASVWNLVQGSSHVYFDSIAVFVFLLLSTRHFLKSLYQYAQRVTPYSEFLAGQSVLVITDDGMEVAKRPLDLVEGERVQVDPDALFPCDGQLLSSEALVDAHVLTGESFPSQVLSGDPVYFGTRNVGERCEVVVEQVGANTRVQQLIQAISSIEKPAIVRFSDLVAKWFLIVIVVLSVVALLAFGDGFQRALALIMVACPCALSLATPLAISLGIQRCSDGGVVVKDPDVFDHMTRCKTLFLDKTGTLTQGILRVSDVEIITPMERHLDLLYSLEYQSQHPLAVAIRHHVLPEASLIELDDVHEVIGTGVYGRYHDYEVSVRQAPPPDQGAYDLCRFVGLYRDEELMVRLTIQDSLQMDTTKTLEHIHQRGIHSVVLSGDTQASVDAVCQRLVIPEGHGALSPEDKVAFVRQRPHSIMVGDGANDAGALAQALVSISVRGSLDMSLKHSDVYFTKEGVWLLPLLLDVSRRCMTTIKLNLGIALIYNIVGVSLVFLGVVTPLLAAFLMPLSALTVFLVTMVRLRSL